MTALEIMTYEVTGAIARITLNRPDRGNSITFATPRELAAPVPRRQAGGVQGARLLRGRRPPGSLVG